MRRFARYRPSPAMAVAVIALFVALTGGATAAALITGKQIKNNSVASVDIKNNSLRSVDIKNNSVQSKDIKNNSVRTQDVKNGSLLAVDFKAGELPAGATGPEGPEGPEGAAGTARAYASVDDGLGAGNPQFLTQRTKNFTAVTRVATGKYCLTIDPTLGIDPLTVAAVTSVEFGNTTSSNVGYAWVRGSATSTCPAGDFAVHTFILVAGVLAASDAVSFNIIAP